MSADDKREIGSQADRSHDRLPLSRRNYLRVTGAAAVGSLAATGGAAARNQQRKERNGAKGQLTATELQVEYEREPNNLQPDQDPRFSWIVSRGTQQDAYRIIVADSASKLRAGSSNIWDSGRVDSNQSTAVEYKGSTLDPNTTYHWMIRIWDKHGTASDWSDPSQFSTAIPDTDDAWEGSWIGPENRTGADWTDYTYESDFTVVKGAAAFLFRLQDKSNFYMWQINTKRGSQPLLRPHVRANGDYQVLSSVSLEDVMGDNPHAQHHFRIEINGDQFTTYIDGQQVDQRSNSTYAQGSIGFRQGPVSHEHARYDNLKITGPDRNILLSDHFKNNEIKRFDDGEISNGQLNLNSTGVVLLAPTSRQKSPLLRTETTLNGSISEAYAHVITLGYGELYVNGERVGDEKLNPAWTIYEDRVLYTTHNVTDLLQEGDNAIGLWLGRGWFSKGNPVKSHGVPRALAQFDITYEDGSTDAITTDMSWQLGRSPISENDVYDGERYDARHEKSGWSKPGFDDSEWASAKESTPPSDDVKRRPQRTPPIEVTKTLEPKTLWTYDGAYVIDFGQNHAGWLELTIRGASEGEEITLQHAEILTEDGDLDRRTLRPSEDVGIASCDATDTYIAKGDNIETYSPRFTYHGFRYAKITGYPDELSSEDIVSKVVHTANKQTGSFACSNKNLNQVHENAVWALQSNAYGIPTDCPQRDERQGWTADTHSAANAHLFNSDVVNFFRQWLDSVGDSQDLTPKGVIGNTIPPGSGTSDPNWGKVRVSLPWFVYQHTGDKRLLREQYHGMKKYVDYWDNIAQADEPMHIIPADKTFFGDHLSPVGAFNNRALMNTAAHYYTTELVAKAASNLNEEDDEADYHERADAIASAFHNNFFNENTASYGNGDQTSFALPLFLGIVPSKREDEVLSTFVDNIRSNDDGKLQTGYVGTRPLIYTLVEHGYVNLAFNIVSQPERPGWVYMVEQGATTTWEGWDMIKRLQNGGVETSRNHHPLNFISEWFYRMLAGIDTDEPGFRTVEIAPVIPDGLNWAKGEIETVRGTVASRWKREATPGKKRTLDGLTLDVTIPGNATATVRVPTLGGEKVRVREGGKPIWNNGHRTGHHHPGVQNVERDDDRIAVEVSSGGYQFELEQLGNGRSRGNK